MTNYDFPTRDSKNKATNAIALPYATPMSWKAKNAVLHRDSLTSIVCLHFQPYQGLHL